MPFTIIIKSFPTPGQEQTQTKDVGGLTLRIGRGTANELQLEDRSIQLTRAVIQEVLTAHFFMTQPHYLKWMLKLKDVEMRT